MMTIDFLHPIWLYKGMKLQITGGIVEFDDEDYGVVSKFKWHVNEMGYAVWRGIKDGVKQTVRMHRLIMNTPKGKVTDHINHNPLDNRKSNLRICTQSDNMRNLRNQGKGYWFQRQNGNWVVEVWHQHIGVFATEQEASEVVALVRGGGTYVKPQRTECKYGHSLKNAYIVNGRKMCRICQSIRSKRYYRRKMS